MSKFKKDATYSEQGQKIDVGSNIYTAPTDEAALVELDAFDEKWGDKFPSIAESWRRNWEQVIPFFPILPMCVK